MAKHQITPHFVIAIRAHVTDSLRFGYAKTMLNSGGIHDVDNKAPVEWRLWQHCPSS